MERGFWLWSAVGLSRTLTWVQPIEVFISNDIHDARMSQPHPVQSGFPVLITIVTNGRTPHLENSIYAREAIDALYRVRAQHFFRLYGFVFMPDHCHLLIRVVAPLTITKIMNSYKSGMFFAVGISEFWQARFHVRIARNIPAALNYIHQNPVVAGLVERPVDYHWSSASGLWDVDSIPTTRRRAAA